MSTGTERLTRATLALILALGTAAALRAQERPEDGLGGGPQGDRPVTDEMLRACPGLKDAAGRKKDQLLALYFDLDWTKAQDEATRKRVASLFDLGQAADAAVLEHALADKGPRRPQTRGLRAVVAASGTPGLVWALRQFDGSPPEGKGNCLDLLFAVRLREAESFLERCLEDAAAVPDRRASQEAPPGYEHLRVCDHALRLLRARWESVEGLPPPKGSEDARSLTPIPRRDAAIAAFKKWLAEDKEVRARIAKAPSALEGLADDKAKEARELFKKLKVSSE